MSTEPAPKYVPPVVDESKDLDIWWLDIVLAVVTLPVLFWAMMYVVTGGEKLVATRAARLKFFGVLLVIEALIVAVIVYLVVK